MVAFAHDLPELRERVAADLASGNAPTRDRVLACAVRLLDRGFFRIGTEEYAEANESYGLATMHKRHVRIEDGDTMVFDFPAKHGKRRVQAVVDADAAALVERLKRRRGGSPELLAFKDAGRWRDVRSADVNAYIKQATGGDHSAKDFRTWSATVLAAIALAVSGEVAGTKTGRDRAINRAVKEVSHYLGNTPAVARASYIDPRVFDAYRAGLIIRPALEAAADTAAPGELPMHHRAIEDAVLDLLDERRRAPGIERIAA
jgi:DNA topoisomerase IB